MSDENPHLKEVHGVNINTNGHDHAVHFLEKHMDRHQFEKLVHGAKDFNPERAKFTAEVNGQNKAFKLEHHHEGIRIVPLHHY